MIAGITARQVRGATYRISKAIPRGVDPAADLADDAYSRAVLARAAAEALSGSGAIIAESFANPQPSRFSDGRYGVWYAADNPDVALAETIHHHQIRMADTGEAPGWVSDFRMLLGRADYELHDVNNAAGARDPDDYTVAQNIGAELRGGHNSNGVVWESVRHEKGACIGLFKQEPVGTQRLGDYFSYHWDGRRVDAIRNVTVNKEFTIAEFGKIRIL